MKRVLVHREGQSGRFMLAILDKFDPSMINFKITDDAESKNFNLTGTHEVNYAKHRKQYDQVLRILPTKNIYHAVYNNFIKKLVVEQTTLNFANWKKDLVNWYDICYYNIKEYYQLITQDINENQYPDIIDFDRILEEQYLNDVLVKYFDQTLDSHRQEILEKYRESQLKINLDYEANNMHDIVKNLDDNLFEQNPWFFSYCIYKYEKNNGLTEQDRKWSIDNIREIQTKASLIDIANCY